MKTTKKIILAAGLLVAGAGFAQTAETSATDGPGILGQRYVELGLAMHDIKFAPDNSFGLSTTANLPVVPELLDVGVSYSYDWIRGPFRSSASTFAATATGFHAMLGMKPFAGLGLGWHTHGFGVDSQGIWGATAGVEIPSGNLTITPRLSYSDDFEVSSASSQQWAWAVETNYWVNPKTGVFGSVGRSDVLHSPGRSWDYQAGVRVRF